MTLSYFYVESISDSLSLKKSISTLGILKEFETNYISEKSSKFSQLDLLLSCHRDDVVIIDCTVPSFLENDTQEEKNKVLSVFPLLVAQVNMLDHVLVLSNNTLPLNVVPQRQGFDSPRLKMKFTREKQLKWVEQQIVELCRLIKTGKHYNRIKIESYLDLSNKQEAMEQMWEASALFRASREKGKKKILISYRSSHYSEVLRYRNEYQARHSGDIVRVIEPGVLCSGEEVLTPMRKWMLVFMLDEFIHDIDELIIYRTDDYIESWWTCAELVMVAYNNLNRSKDKQIKIKYYDIDLDAEIDVEKEDWLVLHFDKYTQNVISEKQKERLARLAANTRPDTMGPEFMANIEQMKMISDKYHNSNFAKRMLMKFAIKQMVKKSIPKSLSDSDKKEILNKTLLLYTNKVALDAYLADEVFDVTFWKSLSYQTQWPTPAFSRIEGKVSIDIDAFLHAPMKEKISLSSAELLERAKKQETITLSSDGIGEKYIVKELSPKYLWLATRMGQPTIKEGNIPGLERIPIYSLHRINSESEGNKECNPDESLRSM